VGGDHDTDELPDGARSARGMTRFPADENDRNGELASLGRRS
jgi:hypothetical protein